MDILKAQASMSKKSGGGLTLYTSKSGTTNADWIFKYNPGVSLIRDNSLIDTSDNRGVNAIGFSFDDKYCFGLNGIDDSQNHLSIWDGSKWALDILPFTFPDATMNSTIDTLVISDDGSQVIVVEHGAGINGNELPTSNRVGNVWTTAVNTLQGVPASIYNFYHISRCGPEHVVLGVQEDGTYDKGIQIYHRNGNKLDFVTSFYGFTPSEIACTDDGTRIIVGLNDAAGFKTFSFNGATITELPTAVNVPERGLGVALTPNGDQAIHTQYGGHISIYNWDGTKYVFHQTLYDGEDNVGIRELNVEVASDGQSLIYKLGVSPYLQIVARSGNDWTNTGTIDVPPTQSFSNMTLSRGVL